MLQAIRDKTTGWIAYLIIFIISVPFALWGVNSYLGGGEAASPATVNGQTISQRQFDVSYANYRRQLEQAFGGAIPAGFDSEGILKEQVLSQLIEETALSQYTDQHYYRIGDQDLNDLIRSNQAFHTDGQFNADIYRSQITSQGYSTLAYEQELRRVQSMGQLQTGVNATAFTVPAIEEKFASLSNQTRKLRVLIRTPSDDISVSEQEIEQYFEQNKDRFKTTEQIRIDYIELSLDAIKSSIEISEEQLRDRYEQSIGAFTSTEARTASHILLTLDSEASDEEVEKQREQLSDIRNQIVQGEDFATLAKTHSQDPVSASEGGSLGEIERGMMVQPFETALFELEVGALSEPVKTSFGWHLIRLEAVSGGESQPFDTVKDELAEELQIELAESQIYDLSESLANLAYEQSDSLLPASEELGLPLLTSEWFDRNFGQGVSSEPQIRNVAFSNEVLEQGLNSEAIELPDNRVVFLRIKDHKPVTQQTLTEVYDQVKAVIRRQKSRDEGIEAGKKALEDLAAGKTLSDIASDWGNPVIDSGFVKRDTTELDSNLVKLAFSMEKPEGVQRYEGYSHSDGRYSIVELSAVLSNDSDEDENKVNALLAVESTADYQAVLQLLAARAEVVRAPLEDLQY